MLSELVALLRLFWFVLLYVETEVSLYSSLGITRQEELEYFEEDLSQCLYQLDERKFADNTI